MGYTFFDSSVVNIIDETPTTKRFFIKIKGIDKFSFKAGQFIMLDLPLASKYTTRSYSIASSPSDDNIIELLIVLNPNGEGTPYLFSKIEIGSTLKVSQAIGKFLLPDVISSDICFICTGTGVAPFRSMLGDIVNKNIPYKKIYLIFGTRYFQDILYKDELEQLQEKIQDFEFIPVLSRETSTSWKGEKGYVHQVYESIFKDKRDAIFYICGWKEMIKEARSRLESAGYSRQQIKFESYD